MFDRSDRARYGLAAVAGVLGAAVGAASSTLLAGHPSNVPGLVVADIAAFLVLVGMVASRQLGRQRWQRALARQMHVEAASPTEPNTDTLPPVLEAELAALLWYLRADQAAVLVDSQGRRTVVAVAGEGPLAIDAEFLAGRPRGIENRPGASIALWPLDRVKSVDLVIAVGTFKERGLPASARRRLRRATKFAGGDIERAWLDDAERRSRLGAAQARRHMAMLVSASGALARALTDWRPALEALAAELVPSHVDYFAVDLKFAGRPPSRVVAIHVDTEHEQFAGDTSLWPEGAPAAIDGAIDHDQLYFSAVGRADRDGPRWPQPEPALAAVAKRLQLHSWMMAPIRSRGEAIGVLTVGTTVLRRGLRPSDVAAYEELAARCGLAIERVQLYVDRAAAAMSAEHAASRLARIVEAAPHVNSMLSVPDVVARATRETVSILDVAVASIVVRKPDGERIVMHWPDDAQDEADRSLEVAESAGTYGRVVRSAIEGADVLAVPVPMGGRSSWAAIAVQGRTGSLTADEESVLRLVAQLTGAAIEHAQLFEAAAASERRTRAIVEASPVAILEIDADDLVVASNAAAVSLLHWDEGDSHDLPLDLVREVDQIRERLEAGGEVVDHRTTLRRPGASPVDLTIAAALVDESGDNVLCMLSDITERNALEREVQVKGRMEALGRLAGGVAHDFNNLLTIIVGHADLVANELTPDHELLPDVEAIRAASQRASAFTEQLLSISRRRVGNEMVVDLAAAIADLETVLRRLIPSNISFVTQLDPIVGKVRVDRSQLDRVMLNLVSNARDSMWGTGGILTIATRRSADDSDAVLTVTDTGVGMDTATLERCFEPFYTTRRASSGTGLGLATVYGIVVQAGGQITVESAPGTGTEFRVTFPITDDELSPVASSGASASPQPATGVVLLVEDEDEVRAVMDQVLARAGYAVHSASSGHRALAVAADLPAIDLLITDVVMPGISGPDLAATLTQRRPGLPVLFVSGYVDSAQRERVLRLQPRSRFLAKPFGIDELAEAVHETMSLGRPTEARRAATSA